MLSTQIEAFTPSSNKRRKHLTRLIKSTLSSFFCTWHHLLSVTETVNCHTHTNVIYNFWGTWNMPKAQPGAILAPRDVWPTAPWCCSLGLLTSLSLSNNVPNDWRIDKGALVKGSYSFFPFICSGVSVFRGTLSVHSLSPTLVLCICCEQLEALTKLPSSPSYKGEKEQRWKGAWLVSLCQLMWSFYTQKLA